MKWGVSAHALALESHCGRRLKFGDFPRSGVLFVIVWPTIIDGWGKRVEPGL